MWPGSYLSSWRKRPQGVEYVEAGESIQSALDRAQFVILAQGAHTAPTGLVMRTDQWLSGVGPSSELTVGATVTVASRCTISDLTVLLGNNYPPHGYAITATNVTDVTIRNTEVDGRVASQTYGPSDNGQSGIALLGTTSRVLIDNCTLHEFGKDCVYVSGARDVLVSRSRLRDFARGGVTTVDCDGLRVSECLFEGGSDLPTVIGNHGVWLEPNGPAAKFERVSVRGCTFKGLRRGLCLHNGQDCETSVTEEANEYVACEHAGIWAYYIHGLRSTGSTFRDCGLVTDVATSTGVANTEGAITVFNSHNARLRGHRFLGCGGYRATVFLGQNTRGCSVEGNDFTADKGSAIYAAHVNGSNTRRLFSGNVCAAAEQSVPAVVLAGTEANPIDSDDVIENTVDGSYSAVHSGTHWTGGRNSPNRVVGS